VADIQTAGKLPIIGTAATAWGDAFRAISAMPALVLSPAIHIVGLCAMAAAASHIFKAYASRLTSPQGGTAVPVTATAA
jgi:hypothetical protein